LCFGQKFKEIDKVVASDRYLYDQFGQSVAISGTYAIVGAPFEDEDSISVNTMTGSGSAYVYEFERGQWHQVQKIVALDRLPGAKFGSSVDVAGNLIMVGASNDRYNVTGSSSKGGAGSVYIFKRNNTGQWRQIQKIVASDRDDWDYFGTSISIDNNNIIVGAYNASNGNPLGNTVGGSGAAYIFEKDTNGVWMETQKLMASDKESGDFFGRSVGISGNFAIVGASNQDKNANGVSSFTDAGAAYLFEKQANGIWIQHQKLLPNDRDVSDFFGNSVSISGTVILIGSSGEDHDPAGSNFMQSSGSAYFFEQSGNIWFQTQKIVSNDRAAGDLFGGSVVLDGNKAVISANGEDEDTFGINTMTGAGSAYIFEKNGTIWTQFQKIVASDRALGDNFSLGAVDISADRIIVGASFEDDDQIGQNTMTSSGSSYFFAPCLPTSTTLIDTACSNYVSPSGNYTWNNSGTYKDTIRNHEGCDSIITIHLTVINPTTSVQIQTTQNQNPKCYNSSDGLISISVSGGNTPYSIRWNTNDTTSNIKNLDSGQYWVNVIDRFGCSDSMHFVLTAPDSMFIQNVSLQKVTCVGKSDGQINIGATGGTPPYKYNWNTGDTIPSLSNLSAGTYSVTIKDSLGCSITDSFRIEEPDKLQILLVNYLDALCQGDANGELNVLGLGGTPPYQYSWSTGEGVPNLSNLSAGTYNLTVTDSNGCSTNGDFIISEPDSLYIKSSEVREATCGKTNAGVELIVEGGSGNVSIEWSNGQTGEKLQNVTGGKYHVTITDGHGCTTEADFNLGDQSQEKVFFANTFTPNGDGINDTYKLLGNPDCFTNANFQVFNRWGEKLFETNKPFGEFWTGSVDGYAPKADVYVIIFTSDEFSESGYVKILR
jgi:gliding motility-associated-like protein